MRPALFGCLLLLSGCRAATSDFELKVTPVTLDVVPGERRTLNLAGEWFGDLEPEDIEVEFRSWPEELGRAFPVALSPSARERAIAIDFPLTMEPGARSVPLVARSQGRVKWQLLDVLVRAAPGALDKTFGDQGVMRPCDQGNEELLDVAVTGGSGEGLMALGRAPGAAVAISLSIDGKVSGGGRQDLSAFGALEPKVFFNDPSRLRNWAGAETPGAVVILASLFELELDAMGMPVQSEPTRIQRPDLRALGAGVFFNGAVYFAATVRANPLELAVLKLDRQGAPLPFTSTNNELARVPLPTSPTASALRVDARGRIYVGGRTATGAFVVRILASGQVDTTFGTGGRSTFLGSGNEVISLLETDRSRLLVAGVNSGQAFVARMTDTGALDPTFGSTGIAFLSGYVSGRVLLAEGKSGLYVAQSVRVAPDDVDFAVSALRDDGTMNTDFGENGLRRISVSTREDAVMDLVPVGDRTLILAGTSRDASGRCFGFARVWQ